MNTTILGGPGFLVTHCIFVMFFGIKIKTNKPCNRKKENTQTHSQESKYIDKVMRRYLKLPVTEIMSRCRYPKTSPTAATGMS